MSINPINFGRNITNSKIPNKKIKNNSLSDIEFNIITDTLRIKNYQNNVDVKLKNLKQNLNG